ncbi:MAG: NADH:ubiquinone reductase (Na(+)-transporting) subunit C [Bacteroidales bacterium]|nr:NADH:ubiquinone reductase (Na(+)-transporting) subunit C [Bacteroidales bacterium]
MKPKFTNRYIIIYAAVLVAVVAVILSVASEALRSRKEANARNEKMQSMLAAIGVQSDLDNANTLYSKYFVEELAIDGRGEVVARFQPADAKNAKDRPFDIDVKAQQTLAKEGKECRLPLFRYQKDGAEGYVVPLHGAGLWGPIWGYVALDEDFTTVVGVSFDHKGETPGLGAKITTPEFQRQFVGKKIKNSEGEFVSVQVLKNADKSSDNEVDAISGATITSSGVSAMLKDCLEPYRGYWGKMGKSGVNNVPAAKIIYIEEVEPPKGIIKTLTYNKLLDSIFSDMGKDNIQIVTHDNSNTSLVYRPHPFFDGLHTAYAEHRPFVLSPDALWLLICQGFASHVNYNAEDLRSMFVDFDGKKVLEVSVPPNSINNSAQWEESFKQFSEQIAGYVGDELVGILTCNFSTSNTVTRTASQITVMATMQKYFEYEIIEVCGIPYVILEGTPDDWHKVLENTQKLRKYKLGWWVDEMVPVLTKIVKASEGEVDKEFWKAMFKYHANPDNEVCGDPNVIADGWIVKFYPYPDNDWLNSLTKEEREKIPAKNLRNDLKKLYDFSSDLPAEIVSVPLRYENIIGNETMLDIWAGFVGLSQDASTYALRPEIGWVVTRKK